MKITNKNLETFQKASEIAAKRMIPAFGARDYDDFKQEAIIRLIDFFKDKEEKPSIKGCVVLAKWAIINWVKRDQMSEKRGGGIPKINVDLVSELDFSVWKETERRFKEKLECLKEAILTLTAREQFIVKSVFFEGHKKKDVCKFLGFSQSLMTQILQLKIYPKLKDYIDRNIN